MGERGRLQTSALQRMVCCGDPDIYIYCLRISSIAISNFRCIVDRYLVIEILNDRNFVIKNSGSRIW